MGLGLSNEYKEIDGLCIKLKEAEADLATAQAQLAVMAKAVQVYLRLGHVCDICYEDGCTSFGLLCDCGCHAQMEVAEEDLKQSLSAAPKVLWSGVVTLEEPEVGIREFYGEDGEYKGQLYFDVGEDGQQVRFIVLDKGEGK